MQDVWIIKKEEFKYQKFIEIFSHLGVIDRIRNAKLVVIKPNLCGGGFADPVGPVVTNREIVRKIIEIVRKINQNTKLLVVESDSIGPGLAKDKFAHQEYDKIIKGIENIELVDLSREPVTTVNINGRFFKNNLVLPSILLDADLIISAAKMKTHSITVLTGATKNLFGCLPDMRKDYFHPYLTDVLLDLRQVLPVYVSVAEGCPAMEGKGPINGKEKNLGLLAVGSDPLIVDAAVAAIMKFPINMVPLLNEGQEILGEKLCENNLNIRGYLPEKNRRRFKFITVENSQYVKMGLYVQKIGHKIEKIGHLVHLIQGSTWLAGKILKRLRRLLSESALESDNKKL